MNAKPLTAIAILMPLLFLGCDDSNSVTGPTLSTVTQMNLAPLKIGDKWTMGLTDDEVKGGLESLTILKDDSIIDGEPVYVGELSTTAQPFTTADGTKFNSFVGTGRIALRKSDQKTVYRFESVLAAVIPVGSTVVQNVRIEEETHSTFTGSMPTVMTSGMVWNVREMASIHTIDYVDDELQDETDSVETKTESYTTKSVYNVTVPAGTFAAIEIDHTVAETGETNVEYYSEAARMTVKQTTQVPGETASLFELRSLSLVK